MTSFLGYKNNTQRSLSRLMMTSALVAAGTLVLSSSAMADPWSDVGGTGFTNTSGGSGITNIVATTANGKASGTGNLDILTGETVNIDAKLFVARDNRATIQTQILGNLNSNGTVVLIDRNGIIFGKDSRVDVGSLIATTGNISDSLALADGNAPLLFTNFGTGDVTNQGNIEATGLVAFVAPTVKNSGVINANLGSVSLVAGSTTATIDLYGDSLVELATSPVVAADAKYLSENTGSITAGKIQMTAAAAKSIADSIVNMQGVLTANSVTINKKGEIVLSAGTVKLGSASVKSPEIKGNANIKATQLDLGLEVDGDISGSAKKVNVLSTKAKIAQGLTVVSAGGTVNVAAGSYNEHLVIDKAGVTLNGANAGVSANGVRGSETIVNPNSPGVTITANNVTVDGLMFAGATGADGYGIFVNGGNNATLKNNIINNNSQNGIYLLNSLSSTISGNLINNTGSHGIHAVNSANANILNNNIGTVGGNNNINGDGILLDKSSGTVIKGNRITQTTSTASQIGSGIHSLNSNKVIIGGPLTADRNIISESEWDNIKISGGADILVENNDLDSATRVGVFALGVYNMTTRNNDIDGSELYGVRYSLVSGTSNIVNNSIDAIGIDGISLINSNKVGITDNTIGYGNNRALGGGDDSAIQNDGISIISSNGTQVYGNKIAHTKRNGIYADTASGSILSGNIVDFTGKSGMHLLNTTDVQILDNKIGTVANNNNINGDGILLEKSTGTKIKRNTITETTSTASQIGSGIHVLNSNEILIGGSVADRNIISQSEWDNVKVTAGNNVTVEANDLETAKRVGVYSEYTNNMVARNNDIDGASMYGVKYMAVTGASSVVGNTIDTIGIDGINIYYSNNNVVTGNTIGYGNDRALGGGDDTVIKQDGISIFYSKGTQATGNKIANAKRNGVYINGESNTTFSGNSIDFSGLDAIQIVSNKNTTVQNNLIGYGANGVLGGDDTTTTRDGIRVDRSSGITLTGNKIVNAGVNGVNLLNASGLIQANTNAINDSAANGILAKNTGAIDLRIVDNTIQNTGFGTAPVGSAAINLDVSGAGTAKLSGNILGNNFEYGLLGFSGTVDLTGAKNTIQNTRVGIGFYPTNPATLALVSNTIGTTAFVDQTDYFVDLGTTGALFAPVSPTLIIGENATYTLGGVTIDPLTAGGVTQAEYDLLQIMLNDYNDVADRGLFFFNVFPQLTTLGTYNQKDVLREFVAPEIVVGNGSLRITGLPIVSQTGAGVVPAPTAAVVFNPNAIEPAAGDESSEIANNIADIQPAAGESESACWSDATNSLGQGGQVTMNFGGSQASLLQNAVSCGNSGQAQSL